MLRDARVGGRRGHRAARGRARGHRLAVELLNRALKRHRAETAIETSNETAETDETPDETARVVRLAPVAGESRPSAEPTAKQRMWAYYVTERAKGRTPTGAELDRIAGTNNYGRRMLRRWRETGRYPATTVSNHRHHAV